jgi:hypothetical protein
VFCLFAAEQYHILVGGLGCFMAAFRYAHVAATRRSRRQQGFDGALDVDIQVVSLLPNTPAGAGTAPTGSSTRGSAAAAASSSSSAEPLAFNCCSIDCGTPNIQYIAVRLVCGHAQHVTCSKFWDETSRGLCAAPGCEQAFGLDLASQNAVARAVEEARKSQSTDVEQKREATEEAQDTQEQDIEASMEDLAEVETVWDFTRCSPIATGGYSVDSIGFAHYVSLFDRLHRDRGCTPLHLWKERTPQVHQPPPPLVPTVTTAKPQTMPPEIPARFTHTISVDETCDDCMQWHARPNGRFFEFSDSQHYGVVHVFTLPTPQFTRHEAWLRGASWLYSSSPQHQEVRWDVYTKRLKFSAAERLKDRDSLEAASRQWQRASSGRHQTHHSHAHVIGAVTINSAEKAAHVRSNTRVKTLITNHIRLNMQTKTEAISVVAGSDSRADMIRKIFTTAVSEGGAIRRTRGPFGFQLPAVHATGTMHKKARTERQRVRITAPVSNDAAPSVDVLPLFPRWEPLYFKRDLVNHTYEVVVDPGSNEATAVLMPLANAIGQALQAQRSDQRMAQLFVPALVSLLRNPTAAAVPVPVVVKLHVLCDDSTRAKTGVGECILELEEEDKTHPRIWLRGLGPGVPVLWSTGLPKGTDAVHKETAEHAMVRLMPYVNAALSQLLHTPHLFLEQRLQVVFRVSSGGGDWKMKGVYC